MKKILILLILGAVLVATDSCGSSQAEREYVESIFSDAECPNHYKVHFDSMPAGGIRLKLSRQIYLIPKLLNDSNKYHIASAKALGIEPINDINDAWNLRRPLELVTSCREFFVDSLTHSYPFLVPEAADLLREIGRRFNDSLKAQGGGDYRIKVTSLLRTAETVKKLRRCNSNAVDTSAHQFGTTFDISYVKFICDSAKTVARRQEDMKGLLGEILIALRDSGRCWVKYERKQSCYHITTRDKSETNGNTK